MEADDHSAHSAWIIEEFPQRQSFSEMWKRCEKWKEGILVRCKRTKYFNV